MYQRIETETSVEYKRVKVDHKLLIETDDFGTCEIDECGCWHNALSCGVCSIYKAINKKDGIEGSVVFDEMLRELIIEINDKHYKTSEIVNDWLERFESYSGQRNGCVLLFREDGVLDCRLIEY